MKKIVISCGPIPAKLDSVKYINNRFKGGLAFETARYLKNLEEKHQLTIVVWKYTPIPPDLNPEFNDELKIVKVDDVREYYKWFEENADKYDAFIMAAAVANLMPSNPFEKKFPSHLYKVGEKFNIEFEIAPRAIDIIKKKNPRACLIGYKLYDAQTDEELIKIAKSTLTESKANIIFANTPSGAKSRKIALTQDDSSIVCTFEEHLELIKRAIFQKYYRTEVVNIPTDKIETKRALATVKMFDQTFKFGTVAVPIENGMFATTSRGHSGEPVIVESVNENVVKASNKATLNAPLLNKLLRLAGPGYIVVHRHEDDPLYSDKPFHYVMDRYLFPGTQEEAESLNGLPINDWLEKDGYVRIKLAYHGDISILPIRDMDWNKYYEQFPEKYFSTRQNMEEIIQSFKGKETLEIGCNNSSDAKYAYDKFVKASNAINLTWNDVLNKKFDLVYARNAINYFTKDEILAVLKRTKHFVANTFRVAPDEKISDREASVSDGKVYHVLRLADDSIVYHDFYAYNEDDWKDMGLIIESCGLKTILIKK